MSILANALPGFRDIRAALVAGYLWLIFGWLLLGETLEARVEAPYLREIVDLANAAGALWTAVAVGVGAYLLGLVSRDVSRVLVRLTRQVLSVRWEVAEAAVSRRREERLAKRTNVEREGRAGSRAATSRPQRTTRDEPSHPRHSSKSAQGLLGVLLRQFEVLGQAVAQLVAAIGAGLIPGVGRIGEALVRGSEVTADQFLPTRVRLSLDRSDPIIRQLVEDRARQAFIPRDEASGESPRAGVDDLGSKETNKIDSQAVRQRTAIETALEDLTEGLRRELDLPATLLVGEQPELFAEADRVRAESELRSAVVPPLIAMAALLSADASPWWAIALIPILQLLVQSVRREDDARRLIGSALLFGRADSAAVNRFDRELREIMA